MAQSVITSAFERLKAQEAAGGNHILIDRFVFANVPGLNVAMTPSADEAMPPAAQIVHRQNIDRNGMVNENTVAYSVLLPESTGDFTFNWLGLVSSATNTLCMVVYLQPQQKIKTADGKQGNTLIYSEIMEYAGASAATGITTPVSTWQIDFTARLHGMDEATRKAALDIYGPGLFFDDAFKITAKGTGQATFAPGIAYLRGLRVELDTTGTLTFATGKAQTVYLDAALTGTLTGENKATFSLTSQKTADYIDSLNQAHYVEPVATISASGVITDIRKTRKAPSALLDGEFLVKDKNLSDLPDVKKALESLTIDHIKKRVEDTHLGTDKLPSFRPSSEDDLTSLPAGYMALAKNKTPGGPLPYNEWVYLHVMGNLDNPDNEPNRKGGVIRLVRVGNPETIWTGVKFDDGTTTTAKFIWARDFNTLNKPTPEDIGLAGTKKAVDDTQIGLSAQAVMIIHSADDLSNLPAGAHRFARNDTEARVLPGPRLYHIEVIAKTYSGNGSTILAVECNPPANVWVGVRYDTTRFADFTWTQLNQTVESLNLTDTVARATGALQKNQNGADIPNKPLFVETLGIVDLYPVGCPIPHPGPIPPSGYLTFSGRAFNKALYPRLAGIYRDGVLPDLRGMFIRGWDNGRALDRPQYPHGMYNGFPGVPAPNTTALYNMQGYQTGLARPGQRGLLTSQYLDAVLTDRDVENQKLVQGEIIEKPAGGHVHYGKLMYVPDPTGITIYRHSEIPGDPNSPVTYDFNGAIRIGAPNVTFNYITRAA